MTNKESGKNAYRTYCRDRLVVSESAEKVEVEEAIKTKKDKKQNKLRKTLSLFMK